MTSIKAFLVSVCQPAMAGRHTVAVSCLLLLFSVKQCSDAEQKDSGSDEHDG